MLLKSILEIQALKTIIPASRCRRYLKKHWIDSLWFWMMGEGEG